MSSKSDFNINFLFDKNLVKEESYRVNLDQPDVETLHKTVLNLPEETITMGKKSGNEENVKIKIILPILKFLGFDISNIFPYRSYENFNIKDLWNHNFKHL